MEITSLNSNQLETTTHGKVESKDVNERSIENGTTVSWSDFTQGISLHGLAYIFNSSFSIWRR